MAFNGSGTFLIDSAGNPVVTGTVISSTWLNALTADLGTGLTNCITRDGQSPATANIPLGGFKLTGVGLAASTGDALSYGRAATVSALTVTGLTGLVTASAGVFSASTTVSLDLTYTGTQTFNGSSSKIAEVVTNAAEPITVSATAATGTIALYPSTQSVLYYTTNSSANFTLNITFSAGTTMNTAMAVGQVMTVAFLNTNGVTPHYASTIQIDGTAVGVTVKWQSAVPTTGNASAIDSYTFAVIKTGSATFTVLASLAPYV